MEKAIMKRRADEDGPVDPRKLPIMRTLATFHECDTSTLISRVDASELDIHHLLREMVSKKEVESSGHRRKEKFSLTLKGWGEYMKALGSIYELPE